MGQRALFFNETTLIMVAAKMKIQERKKKKAKMEQFEIIINKYDNR
jgi:hypothetical protein